MRGVIIMKCLLNGRRSTTRAGCEKHCLGEDLVRESRCEDGECPHTFVSLFADVIRARQRCSFHHAALMPCRPYEPSLQVKNTTSPSAVAPPECKTLAG